MSFLFTLMLATAVQAHEGFVFQAANLKPVLTDDPALGFGYEVTKSLEHALQKTEQLPTPFRLRDPESLRVAEWSKLITTPEFRALPSAKQAARNVIFREVHQVLKFDALIVDGRMFILDGARLEIPPRVDAFAEALRIEARKGRLNRLIKYRPVARLAEVHDQAYPDRRLNELRVYKNLRDIAARTTCGGSLDSAVERRNDPSHVDDILDFDWR